MANLVKYVSAGTVEYLYNPDDRKYYFLELNPRLQVMILNADSLLFEKDYIVFKYSLIIHEENTNKISTMSETICDNILLKIYLGFLRLRQR